MPKIALQRGLHLHLTELFDSEVQILQDFFLFYWVVLQQKLGELEIGEGQFGRNLIYVQALIAS
jgi:hypothetical protein